MFIKGNCIFFIVQVLLRTAGKRILDVNKHNSGGRALIIELDPFSEYLNKLDIFNAEFNDVVVPPQKKMD